MTNQVILWSTLIVPWLTLFFMKREDIKRYMPAALFSVVISTILVDAGVRLGFWAIRETSFPFYIMLPYIYGLYPVATIWVLKFTNGSLLVYMITNAILDLGFSYIFLGYFIATRGIVDFGITKFQDWLLAIGRAIVIYIYQKWQENELLPVKENLLSPNLHSAVAKPFLKRKHD